MADLVAYHLGSLAGRCKPQASTDIEAPSPAFRVAYVEAPRHDPIWRHPNTQARNCSINQFDDLIGRLEISDCCG
jgi:hypothetical protein